MISQCFTCKVYTVSLFGRIHSIIRKKKNCLRFTPKILTIIDTYLVFSLHEI